MSAGLVRHSVLIVVAAIALAACGGGDEASPASDASDAKPDDITVGEFIGMIQPEKQETLKIYVASSAACEGTPVSPSFTLVVTAAGLEEDPNGPLLDLVEAQC